MPGTELAAAIAAANGQHEDATPVTTPISGRLGFGADAFEHPAASIPTNDRPIELVTPDSLHRASNRSDCRWRHIAVFAGAFRHGQCFGCLASIQPNLS